MKTRLFCLLFTCLLFGSAYANIDTLAIPSKEMKRELPCVVILPSNYDHDTLHYPVVYLLHGARGGFNNWVTRVPNMQAMADAYKVIIICPEGGAMGWYLDSPINDTMRFETFIAKEVTAFTDERYRTIRQRGGRAICGLSMGGHGAYYIALRNPTIFGAAGSMSGAFDISLIAKPYQIEALLGDVKQNASRYQEHAVLNLLDRYPKDSLALILDCGAQDFVAYMSRAVHQKMVKLGIPHDYTERPGRHDWAYWGKAVQYQLLFFRQYFDRQAT